VNPNLARIGEKAKAHPKLEFTSLYHHIADIEHLRTCYQQLKGHKAVGVDEVTKSMYAADLEANLQDLSARLKRMGYRPQPKRRLYIPKPGSETGRPLGISSFEDRSYWIPGSSASLWPKNFPVFLRLLKSQDLQEEIVTQIG
jgi:RNA-directed DNA polymerase